MVCIVFLIKTLLTKTNFSTYWKLNHLIYLDYFTTVTTVAKVVDLLRVSYEVQVSIHFQ